MHPDEAPLFELFHHQSNLRPNDYSYYAVIKFINSTHWIREIISSPVTSYKSGDSIILSKDAAVNEQNFEQVLVTRRTRRDFSRAPATLSQLSRILYLGSGVIERRQMENNTWGLRGAPSPGGLYAIDTYCYVRSVSNVAEGLYFYDPDRHVLGQTHCRADDESLINIMPSLKQELLNSCFTIFLVSVMSRIKFKYGERAYRFALLETGHMAQNYLLTSNAEKMGAIPVGGYIDGFANELLSLDGVNEMVQYILVFGSV